MLSADRSAVVRVGEQSIVGQEVLKRQVGGPAVVVGVADDELHFWLYAGSIEQVPCGHALPDVPKARPARDAVEVREDLDPRQCLKFLQAERQLLLYKPEHPKRPPGKPRTQQRMSPSELAGAPKASSTGHFLVRGLTWWESRASASVRADDGTDSSLLWAWWITRLVNGLIPILMKGHG
jgi:hypothetical protein